MHPSFPYHLCFLVALQDLLSVRTPDERDVLVPFVSEIVPSVDIVARRIVIDPPPGLLEDVEP